MKVYVITFGEYSDYHIKAVSVDKEDAERKCALLNKSTNEEYYRIEEYDTEDMKVDTTEDVRKSFRMYVGSGTGQIRSFFELGLTFDDINEIYKWDNGLIRITASFPKNTDKEKAKKIMFDRVAKFKAEKAEIWWNGGLS